VTSEIALTPTDCRHQLGLSSAALKMDSSDWGHHQYRASCLLACLPGIPPVSLRIVTGAPKAKDPVLDCLQHRTKRLKDAKKQSLKMMKLWDYYNSLDFVFCFVFLYICLPELKVCIYFSLKRLVFNSGGKFCCPNKLFLSILTEKE